MADVLVDAADGARVGSAQEGGARWSTADLLTGTPDFWLTVDAVPYPSGSTTTYRWGQKGMAFPTWIEGRVAADGWGRVTQALSDWRGRAEASTVTAELEDSDGVVRALALGIGASIYANSETALNLLSEAGRHAGLTPRVVHRGYLRRPPRPRPDRKASIEVVDILGKRLVDDEPLQRVFITREHLEPAGITGTPADKIGKPYNIVVGEHSDLGALDQAGNAADKGMVPPDYLGKTILTSGVIDPEPTVVDVPPPVITQAQVIGSGGPETYYYGVSGIFKVADDVSWPYPSVEETVISEIAVVAGAPTIRTASDYIRISWEPPPGWADYYEANCIGIRICGRSTNPPIRYLDIGRHSRLGDGLEDWSAGGLGTGTYDDDDDNDMEKEPPPPYPGTAKKVEGGGGPSSAEWGVFAVALGAVEIIDIHGTSGGEEPKRIRLPETEPNVLSPLSAGWTGPPYVEVNGVRLTVFYARGNVLEHHLCGIATLAVCCCGVEDVGDATGTPITEAGPGLQWLLNEIVLKDGGAGYRTGNWGPLEAYGDGTAILKTSSFAAMQAATVGFIGGRGYQMHLCLTAAVTVEEVLQWWCETFHAYVGPTPHGQVSAHVLDDYADLADARALRHKVEIDGPLPEPTMADDEVENKVPYRYDWDADADAFRVETQFAYDDGQADSEAMYGVRSAAGGRTPTPDDFVPLRCTRDEATAADAMRRRLRHNLATPVYQPIPLGLLGLEIALGDLVRLTHPDGLGAGGWSERGFFVTRRELDPNAGRVVLTARDAQRALDAAPIPVEHSVEGAEVAVAASEAAALDVTVLSDLDYRTSAQSQRVAVAEDAFVEMTEAGGGVPDAADGAAVAAAEAAAAEPSGVLEPVEAAAIAVDERGDLVAGEVAGAEAADAAPIGASEATSVSVSGVVPIEAGDPVLVGASEAPALPAPLELFVVKGANETVTNSSTLQDDDHLAFDVGANQVWLLEFTMVGEASSSTPDAKLALSVPTGTTGQWGAFAPGLGIGGSVAYTHLVTSNATFAALPVGMQTNDNPPTCTVRGIIATTQAGTVRLRWCNNTAASGQSTTFYGGSSAEGCWLKATRVQ